MSPYRWVREAAAKHPTIDKEWIEKSIKDHEELVTDPSTDTPYDFWNVVEKIKFGLLDRYILKGLINNPNFPWLGCHTYSSFFHFLTHI
jgi:hypothetical protein